MIGSCNIRNIIEIIVVTISMPVLILLVERRLRKWK